ncbi:hypothetical protein E4634_03220 [Mangrovimicrobium sediminis]|uniref:Uncharacterized protein n=1 Tax=Mangrovimicrobium sediminis TaxID=2562682 RepID=A0A4Z0M7T2_9GAMM|nr:hypothetical protein [Haliea sp. SAOS-164]TGD75470.1 hypothetical protein E4634_03220 [Haliea sp. SAOS-164]
MASTAARADFEAWQAASDAFEQRLQATDAVADHQVGEWITFDLETCFETNSFCFGNNPESGYSFAHLPWRSPELIRYSTGFMLDDNEAVVLLLQTPPQLAYFGFTPYVQDRWVPETDNQRIEVAASLADSINHLRLGAYPAAIPGAAPYPFERISAVVMSANQRAVAAVSSLLVASGIPARAVNVFRIPTGAIELPLVTGYTERSDEFAIMARYTLPADRATFEAWLAANPVSVYRITLDTPEFESFPFTGYRERVTGISEYDDAVMPQVMSRLGKVVAALVQRHPEATPEIYLRGIGHAGLGHECINDYSSCIYDNQDALYYRHEVSPPVYRLTSDPGNFWYAVGVEHQRTSKALYTSHSVYMARNAGGVASINTGTARGSVEFYAGDWLGNMDIGDPNDFYIFRIARQCGLAELELGYCVEVPYPTPLSPVGVEDTDPLTFVTRYYVEMNSGVGPAQSEIAPPVFVVYE